MRYEDYIDFYDSTSICSYSSTATKTGSLLLTQKNQESNLIEFEVKTKTFIILKVNQLQKRLLKNSNYEVGKVSLMVAKKQGDKWIHFGGSFAEKDENYYLEFEKKFEEGVYAAYIQLH